jgi:microcystin degradation protein MlrC
VPRALKWRAVHANNLMRVFTASLATETNTFGPIPTGAAAFEARGYFPAGKHPEALSFFAAPLWVARQVAAEQGWTLIEGLVAGAQPGGITTRAVYISAHRHCRARA